MRCLDVVKVFGVYWRYSGCTGGIRDILEISGCSGSVLEFWRCSMSSGGALHSRGILGDLGVFFSEDGWLVSFLVVNTAPAIMAGALLVKCTFPHGV